MFPVKQTGYISEGLARFTSNYTSDRAPNLRNLATVYLTGVQELENAIFATIEGKWLANAVGVDLDVIGDLVGQPRTGLDDNTYRAIIRLRIRANRSEGRSEDLVQLSVVIANKLTSDANGRVGYYESGVSGFIVTITNLLYPSIAQDLLNEAKAIGTQGELVYSTWAPGDDFSFTSVSDASAGEAGWGSVSDSTVGGLLLADLGI